MPKYYGYVYLTKNLVNGKMYIGLHSNSRFDPKYLGSGTLLRYALKKYGKQNFVVTPLFFATTIKKLNSLEIKTIKKFRKQYGENSLYNLMEGGFQKGLQGSHHSIKTLREQSKRQTGSHHSAETKEKQRLAHLGRPLTEECKEKIRIARKKQISPMLGKNHSLRTKQQISNSKKGQIPWIRGRHRTDESKQLIRLKALGRPAAFKGRHHTPEVKKILSEQKIGIALSPEHIYKIRLGQKNSIHTGMLGRKHSAASNKKNSLSHLGRSWSEETYVSRTNTYIRKLWAKHALMAEQINLGGK